MKKAFYIIMCIAIILMTGCNNANSNNRSTNKQSSVEDVLQAGMQAEDGQNSDINQGSEQVDNTNEDGSVVLSTTEGIDIDLTSLSSTMVYSEVYNMMMVPEDYIGKVVRMEGTFATYKNEETGTIYYACIIKDATACCAQGMEFVLTKDYSYPDDYPKEGDEITVVGEFSTYMEGEFTYCTLKNATLVDLKR